METKKITHYYGQNQFWGKVQVSDPTMETMETELIQCSTPENTRNLNKYAYFFAKKCMGI